VTISTEAIKSSVFAGNGSTTGFAITFKTFSQNDLTVTLTNSSGVESVKSLTTHYTVSLNANQDNNPGGTVTMGTPPANGEKLVIANEPEYTQSSDIVNGGGFFPNVIEDMVDRNTILSRRAQEVTSRSIKIPISDSTGTTVELPTETLRASKAVVFDANGNVGVSTDNYVDQVATVAASATAAANSATAAATSATTASTSASTASTQATNSSNSATSSASSATSSASSATAAATSEANAEASAGALAWKYTFSNSTTMGDPGTGTLRFNHATIGSVTQLAFDATSADSGNPDVSDLIASIDDGTNSTHEGYIFVRKSGTPATFAAFNVTNAITDSTGWLSVPVTTAASNGTISNSDTLYISFARSGNVGAQGATGNTGAAGSDGKTVLSGSGAPGGGTGVDGDFYIDTSGNNIHGPKASGSWPSGVSLVGPTGATGATGPQGPTGEATIGDIIALG